MDIDCLGTPTPRARLTASGFGSHLPESLYVVSPAIYLSFSVIFKTAKVDQRTVRRTCAYLRRFNTYCQLSTPPTYCFIHTIPHLNIWCTARTLQAGNRHGNIKSDHFPPPLKIPAKRNGQKTVYPTCESVKLIPITPRFIENGFVGWLPASHTPVGAYLVRIFSAHFSTSQLIRCPHSQNRSRRLIFILSPFGLCARKLPQAGHS